MESKDFTEDDNSIDNLSENSKINKKRQRMKPRSSQALVTRHVSKKIVIETIENESNEDKKSVSSINSIQSSVKPKTEA